MTLESTVGIVLAAGAGRRMGTPKALVDDGDWLNRSVDAVLEAGCGSVIVVLGARVEEARALLTVDDRVRVVVAESWADGMSASLKAGLAEAAREDATAAVITLVDLPGLPTAAVSRVVAGAAASALRQATYDGRPGHPVLIGRDHWHGVVAEVAGDSGAREYLVRHDAVAVDCSDLWDGRDVDHR